MFNGVQYLLLVLSYQRFFSLFWNQVTYFELPLGLTDESIKQNSVVTGSVCDMKRRKRASITARVPVSCWTQMILQNVIIRADRSVTVMDHDKTISWSFLNTDKTWPLCKLQRWPNISLSSEHQSRAKPRTQKSLQPESYHKSFQIPSYRDTSRYSRLGFSKVHPHWNE